MGKNDSEIKFMNDILWTFAGKILKKPLNFRKKYLPTSFYIKYTKPHQNLNGWLDDFSWLTKKSFPFPLLVEKYSFSGFEWMNDQWTIARNIGFFFPVSPKNARFLEKCSFDQMPVCGNDHSKTGIFSIKMPKRASPKRAFSEKNDHNYKNDHTQTGIFQNIFDKNYKKCFIKQAIFIINLNQIDIFWIFEKNGQYQIGHTGILKTGIFFVFWKKRAFSKRSFFEKIKKRAFPKRPFFENLISKRAFFKFSNGKKKNLWPGKKNLVILAGD